MSLAQKRTDPMHVLVPWTHRLGIGYIWKKYIHIHMYLNKSTPSTPQNMNMHMHGIPAPVQGSLIADKHMHKCMVGREQVRVFTCACLCMEEWEWHCVASHGPLILPAHSPPADPPTSSSSSAQRFMTFSTSSMKACLWRPEVFDLKASDAFFTMGTMSGGASWMARASVVLNNLAPPAIQSLN